MRVLGLVASTVVLFAVVGCKKEPSLVGSWDGEFSGQAAILDLKEDGTLNVKANVASYDIAVDGTYKLAGKTLSLTPSKFSVKGLPPELKKISDDFAKKVVGKEQTGTLVWKGEDEFELTPLVAPADSKAAAPKPGKPVTFRRKKEAK